MAERYGALTLQLKQLSNLANIGSTYTNIRSASGTQKISESGSGSFVVPRHYATINAIESNIGQVAYVYQTDQVASGAAMDVATFIIKEVDKQTDESGLTVTVSGDGITDQLTYRDLGDDTIDDGSGNADTSDVDSIMAYAPSGWTYDIDGGAGTGSSNGSYFTSRGNNVLQLLISAAKQNSGDFWRLSSYSPPAKTISWRTSGDSSGVTLRMPETPTDYDGGTATGIIFNMSEDSSFEDVVTRVRPYGAGLDDGRLDITDIGSGDTGGDPAGYTTTFASNVVVNTTLETSLGYTIERDVDFSRNRAADVTNATQLTTAAVALWNEAITYLKARDSTKKFYRVQCNVPADLRPGQTVTIVYTEYEGGVTGGNAVWSVNDSFYIHQVTNSVGKDGIRMTSLVVSDAIAPKATGGRVLANAVQSMRETTRKSNALTTPGSVATSRTISTNAPLIGGGDLSANRIFSLGTLNSYGSANQLIGINAAASDVQYKTLVAGGNASIAHGAGTVTIDADVGTGDLHDAVTLGADTAPLFSIGAGQILTFDTQAANTVLAGPTSGGATDPTMRTLVFADIPSSSDPGVAASVLATDSTGDIYVRGVTAHAGTNSDSNIASSLLIAIGGNVSSSQQSASAALNAFVYSSTAEHIPTFRGRKALGTRSTPSAVGSGTVLGRFGGAGYNGSAFPSESNAYIEFRATETHSGTAAGSHIRFGTTQNSSTTSAEVMRLENAGRLLLAETSNANQTIGLTINMAANTDEIATLKQSNVAHGITNETDTDAFGTFKPRSGTDGGLLVTGYHEGTPALTLRGTGVTDATGKAAASNAYVMIDAQKKSGAGVGNPGAGANLLAIRSNGSSIAIFAEDGDLYLDTVVNENHWDAYDDVALLHGLRAAMVPDGHELQRRFGHFIEDAREVLTSTGVLTFNENGHHFIATKKLQMLTIDALRQMYENINERLIALETS